MNYGRFKKLIVWLALLFIFALPITPIFTSPAYAQGYYRRYDRRDYGRYTRRYDPYWQRRAYPYPGVRGRYWNGYPYQYGYYPWARSYGYPYGYPYRYGHRYRWQF